MGNLSEEEKIIQKEKNKDKIIITVNREVKSILLENITSHKDLMRGFHRAKKLFLKGE